jgi:hypothetical protein
MTGSLVTFDVLLWPVGAHFCIRGMRENPYKNGRPVFKIPATACPAILRQSPLIGNRETVSPALPTATATDDDDGP